MPAWRAPSQRAPDAPRPGGFRVCAVRAGTAVVAGALTPRDGFRVIANRSRVMSQLAGQGAVALIKLDAEATAELIADFPEVSVAGRGPGTGAS